MRIVVTGAAGFIATNLLERLLAQGHEVHGIDNFFLGKREYIARSLENPGFAFHEFDLLDRDRVVSLFQRLRPELVWHLAANSDISYGTSYTDFDLKGGTLVTYNLLEAMRVSNTKQLIFSSSGAIYGEPTILPTPENYGPLFPISFYAASKIACETLITAFAAGYQMKCWMFRFGNIVGGYPTHGVIHDFVLKLQRDPTTLQRSVNLHFQMGADEAGAKVARDKLQQFPPAQQLGAVVGTAPQVIDRIAEYMEAGADGLNIAFRPPIDWDAFEAYIARVLPVFHQSA